jgi:hypothetical protein
MNGFLKTTLKSSTIGAALGMALYFYDRSKMRAYLKARSH